MGLPTFNTFSFQDSNFIAERIEFKGFAERAVIRGRVGRREGVKLLNSEYGEKEIEISGIVVADSASDLQTKLDGLKKNTQVEEGNLVIEADRTFKATISNLGIPDEHYNQSKAPFSVTFICTNPYAEGTQENATIDVPSGQFTISGTTTISGTFFNRPTITYTPAGAAAGNTLINSLNIYHIQSGQTVTVSGFGSGTGLDYGDIVTVNFETFASLEGTSEIDNSGAFAKWNTGTNDFTVTSNGAFVGGTITISYQPRYI